MLGLLLRCLFLFALCLCMNCQRSGSSEYNWSFEPFKESDTTILLVEGSTIHSKMFDATYIYALDDFKQRFDHLFDQVVYYTKIDSMFYFCIFKGDTLNTVVDTELGIFELEDDGQLGLVDQNGIEVIPIDHHKIYNFGSILPNYFTTQSNKGYQFYDIEGHPLLPSPHPSITWDDSVNHQIICKDQKETYIISYLDTLGDTSFVNQSTIPWYKTDRSGISFIMNIPPFDQIPYQDYSWVSDSSVHVLNKEVIFSYHSSNTIVHLLWYEVTQSWSISQDTLRFITLVSMDKTNCLRSSSIKLNVLMDSMCLSYLQCQAIQPTLLQIRGCFVNNMPYPSLIDAEWLSNYTYFRIEDEGTVYQVDEDGFFDFSALVKIDSTFIHGIFNPNDPIRVMNNEMMDLLRNELLARSGFIFNQPYWDTLFKKTDWYIPSDVNKLNTIEQYNIQWLLNYAESKK